MSHTAVAAHPVLGCVAAVRAAVGEVADVEPLFMTTTEKQAALVELAAAEAQLTELRLRVLAAADHLGDVADDTGARDAAAWMSHATRTDPHAARADAHLARSLQTRPLVAAGMRRGAVNAAQARAIATGIEDLPSHLGADLAARAEQTLVEYADHHRPAELRTLARRILEVVAPDIADAEDARRLEAEEARAHAAAALRFHPTGEGSTRVTALLPDHVAGRLKTYLDAYTSPRQHHRQIGGEADRIPLHRKRAHALAALLEHLDPAKLPEHGGTATTVIVTMTLDQLRTDLATAGLLTPDTPSATISATEARRLACTASLLPAVLDGAGEVLDLGRGQRLFSKAQHRALRLRDQRCRADGCTIPAAWTEAHHLTPWHQGGATDLANAISLCSHHHHLIHARTHHHDRLPNGDVRFHRRR